MRKVLSGFLVQKVVEQRLRLIENLRQEIKDERVLEVMAKVPRELFVPEELRAAVYEDRPLPIGFGQTISQPFIVALMTQALELTGKEKVLEIGTGSGYQTAILAELAKEVITTERIPELLAQAQKRLLSLGYNNVRLFLAEKILGWVKEAPYDRIMVTAGAPQIPNSLLSQLKTGGIMVIPIGSKYDQELLKVTKLEHELKMENLGLCRFVPLIGEEAWSENEL